MTPTMGLWGFFLGVGGGRGGRKCIKCDGGCISVYFLFLAFVWGVREEGKRSGGGRKSVAPGLKTPKYWKSVLATWFLFFKKKGGNGDAAGEGGLLQLTKSEGVGETWYGYSMEGKGGVREF